MVIHTLIEPVERVGGKVEVVELDRLRVKHLLVLEPMAEGFQKEVAAVCQLSGLAANIVSQFAAEDHQLLYAHIEKMYGSFGEDWQRAAKDLHAFLSVDVRDIKSMTSDEMAMWLELVHEKLSEQLDA